MEGSLATCTRTAAFGRVASVQAASVLGGTANAPLNCSIFLTDVVGFGGPCRDDHDRRVVRNALCQIVRAAFERSNVPWTMCVHESRGDGVLSVAPSHVSTVLLVEPLLALLSTMLKRYNRQAAEPVRLRVRAALHVGPVYYDECGLSGSALIHAARMLEAPVLKESLADSGADLGFIASGHVYETVIRHACGFVDATEFRRVPVSVKQMRAGCWMYLAPSDSRSSGVPAARPE